VSGTSWWVVLAATAVGAAPAIGGSMSGRVVAQRRARSSRVTEDGWAAASCAVSTFRVAGRAIPSSASGSAMCCPSKTTSMRQSGLKVAPQPETVLFSRSGYTDGLREAADSRDYVAPTWRSGLVALARVSTSSSPTAGRQWPASCRWIVRPCWSSSCRRACLRGRNNPTAAALKVLRGSAREAPYPISSATSAAER